MYSRIFAQTGSGSVGKFFGLYGKSMSTLRLGRMAPETTIDIIEQELHAELKEKGLVKLGKTLEEEQKILLDLQAKQKDNLNRIKEACVNPTQKRLAQGYSINGLFWSLKQKEMNQIATKEAMQTREETIDWLKARQDLYAALKHGSDKNCSLS
ncbi:hypothetical protein LEAN103870_04115 [Legionella anisa]|uniref:Uncharacterized protein n=1 Tax=Legionella anisa TaxID=28082 RepID=A0AAX0WNW3_9GAMM|nr:hypothetical protein [Legionella anisa]AWN72951.1 hypothetical protein DLD14_03350 [Legionella anisa]KTC70592.1 hypothetical protein Lani_2139 [Legionella anisa]MBN5935103.1 hypothetical protein [Legionella anisa]MCW8423765.1 hypothetical protein [Legionella anisa]MCW8447285.1 hypothetical protein [Legionella anisa]